MTAKPDALVLVTTSFPILGDGSEAAGGFVADLATELAARVPVRVVAPGPEQACEAWAPGVQVHRFKAPDRPLSTLKPWHPGNLLAIRSVLASGLAATRGAVAEGPTAHLLGLWALPSGHWARVVSRETGIPYSVWTLGSDIWSLGRIPVLRHYLRSVLAGASHCYSDGLKLAEETSAIAGRAVEFLPSTRRIDTTRAQPRRQAPPYRLLFLGRWHPNKGIDLLLESLDLLDDADWARIESVTVCGGGPMASLVDAGVARLKASGRPVHLRGFLDKPQAEEAIANADFLLIPSRIESIPVVFSDAMKLGCPVVCTPVGDLPVLVSEGRVGTLAAAATGASFRDALATSLMSRGPLHELRTDETAERFRLETVAMSILEATASPPCLIGD